MTAIPKTLISDVLGCKIITAEGKFIGHVADLRLTTGYTHKVTALYYGGIGWLHRWHVLYPFTELFGLRPEAGELPWEAIERFSEHKIHLKPGWPKPLEQK